MVTITYVAERSSNDDAFSRHGLVLELLLDAALLPERPGLTDLLSQISVAVRADEMTPEVAFDLAQQLRLLIGDHPVDDDVAGHLLLEALLSELIEIVSHVDDVHVDDIDPLVERMLATGDLVDAKRLVHRVEAARIRVGILENNLAADLGAA